MNHCPVYTRVGGHAYGTTYPGPIGQILMPHLKGLEATSDFPSASSLCGACGEVCPVKIPIPDLLVRLRREAVDGDSERPARVSGHGVKRRTSEVLAWRLWAWLNKHPRLYRLGLSVAIPLRRLQPQNVGAWTDYRSSPRLAPRTLHQQLRGRDQPQRPTTIPDSPSNPSGKKS